MQTGEKFQINLVQKTAFITMLAGCSGTALMFIFGEQAIELTAMAVFASVTSVMLYLFIKFNPYFADNGLILLLGISLIVLILTTFSGAVNSRFAVLIPILPIMMCLILTRRMAIAISVFIMLYILSLTLLGDRLIDFTRLAHAVQEVFAKTLWLILATALGLAFGLVFVDINSKLSFQLEEAESKKTDAGMYSKEGVLAFAENMLFKLANSKGRQQKLCLAIVEIIDNELNDKVDDKVILSQVGRVLKRVISQDTDVVGHYLDNQILVCL